MNLSEILAVPTQKAERTEMLHSIISKEESRMSSTNTNIITVMKSYFDRLIAAFLALVAMISGGKTGRIELEVTQPVTVTSEQIVMEVRNYSGKALNFDEVFVLEKNEGDEWVQVAFAEHAGFHEIGIKLSPLGTYTQTIDVLSMFGHFLEAGEYKLTKQLNQKDYCAVFTVTE